MELFSVTKESHQFSCEFRTGIWWLHFHFFFHLICGTFACSLLKNIDSVALPTTALPRFSHRYVTVKCCLTWHKYITNQRNQPIKCGRSILVSVNHGQRLTKFVKNHLRVVTGFDEIKQSHWLPRACWYLSRREFFGILKPEMNVSIKPDMDQWQFVCSQDIFEEKYNSWMRMSS